LDNFFKYEKGFFLNDILAAYRIHKESKSSTVNAKLVVEEFNSIRKIRGNILLRFYYRIRRWVHYLFYSNFISTIIEKIRISFFKKNIS
jgi:hypothetical protein